MNNIEALWCGETRTIVTFHEPFVTAVIIDGDGNVVKGHAKCDPADEFDYDFGKSLAVSRAHSRYYRKMERRLARSHR